METKNFALEVKIKVNVKLDSESTRPDNSMAKIVLNVFYDK